MSPLKTLHLLVKGRVQGVFFRATAKEQADLLRLSGWVKNTDAGDVEVLVRGEASAVEDFVKWCEKGPKRAMVESVARTEMETETGDGFEIRR